MTLSTDIGLRIQTNPSPCPLSRRRAKAPSFLTLRFGPSWKPCSLLACSGRQAPGGSTPTGLTTLRSPGRPLEENHKFCFVFPHKQGPMPSGLTPARPPTPVAGPNPQGCHGGLCLQPSREGPCGRSLPGPASSPTPLPPPARGHRGNVHSPERRRRR